MRYPNITINSEKLKHNTKVVLELSNKSNIDPAVVTKVFCGHPDISKVIADSGISMLADSRVENLAKIQHLKVQKLMLRLPMISQVTEVVSYADISLNSELDTIKALGNAALEQNKIHDIILMIDLGDLREGVLYKDALSMVEQILKMEGVSLKGIGTNLTCYGGVIPKEDNLGQLVKLAREIEDKFGVTLKYVSGGNSSSYYLLEQGQLPDGINNLRLGEVVVLGRETAYGNKVKGMYQDIFTLEAEIIEIKQKPSVPIGEIGMDAFGKKPVFQDRGTVKRAILAVGKQDVDVSEIVPKDHQINILGGSSDHLILDITNCEKEYKVGDIVAFNLNYSSILSLMTSDYIFKNMI